MMAGKSDFAQKLLHDLRLRKERMAASQSSNRESYRNTGQTHRGSRQIKALESIGGSKAGNQRPMSSGGGRALDMKESSQQIVSYGGGRNRRQESIGDLSVAFAYEQRNGRKVVNMDFSGAHSNTMIDFLQQIGRRSLDMGKVEKGGSLVKHRSSNGSFPTLTNIQIKEIAKGVQNLNQILKASSNGMNLDKYSMEIGKELLKGAKGLEESLRMLVNLQEASEYMVTPQRKSRITLVEVDEDDEDNRLKMKDQKQVEPPRFSFDKPKKSYLALTNTTDSSKLVTHQRSASCSDDNIRSLSTVPDTKNSSSRSLPSKSEKGRISNVIAKLMGLEEIPVKLDPQSTHNESSSRKKEQTVMKTTYTTNSKITEPRSGGSVKQVNKKSPTTEAVVSLEVAKSQPSNDFNVTYTTNHMAGPDRSRVTVGRQQSNSNESDQVPEKRKNGLEKERGRPKGIEHDENKEEKMPQKQRSQEVAVNTQQERVEKKKTIRMEKNNEIRLIPGHNPKQKSERRIQKISKQESEHRKDNKSQIKPKISAKPLDESTSFQKDLPLKELPIQPSEESLKKKVINEDLKDGNMNKDVPPREQEAKAETIGPSLQPKLVKEKPVHVPVTRKKVDSVAVHRSEAPQRRDVLKIRNGIPDNLGRPSKHKLSMMQDIKQGRKKTKSKGVETSIKESNKSESSTRPIKEEMKTQDEREVPATLNMTAMDLLLEDSSQNTMSEVSTISNDQKGETQAPTCRDEIELKSQETSQILLAGSCEGSIVTYSQDKPGKAVYSAPTCRDEIEPKPQETSQILLAGSCEVSIETCSRNKPKKAFYSGTQVVLAEQEKQLKEILMKDQLFLNTAEALFKLNIPVGILDVDDQICHGEETKLKLDCGYEIMRRKAKSQELAVHPYMKISISNTTAIRYLDDLVKQLYKDLESLRFYGRNARDEFDTTDYLHNMLERDIQNKDPDINSFWDFGWNAATFASVEKDEFTKDVEQDVLNGLIDEITEDLLSMVLSY